jgi:hypothetical protein
MKKILLFTAVIAMVLGGTALAADWNFYGSARMQTFVNNNSKELATGNSYVTNPLAGAAGKSWTETSWAAHSNSRIGANVEAGDVKGRFEYGNTPQLRILYGRWNFGSGELAVGQYYTPTYYGFGNSVYATDNGLAGFGVTGAGRAPMIRLKFGGFEIAGVTPNTTITPVGTYTNKKVTLPKLELSYAGAAGPVAFHVGAGMQSIDMVNAADNSKSVTAWVAAGKVQYGAGPFEIGLSANYGVNMAEYGWSMGALNTVGVTATDYKDTKGYGAALYVGFKINDMLGVEAGYGYQLSQADSSVVPGGKDDIGMQYYVQLPITLADGVFIIPEVGKFDYDVDFANAKQGDLTYFGAKWMINF